MLQLFCSLLRFNSSRHIAIGLDAVSLQIIGTLCISHVCSLETYPHTTKRVLLNYFALSFRSAGHYDYPAG
jgi:hypothetical protein